MGVKIRHTLSLLGALILLTAFVAACGGTANVGGDAGDPVRGGTLRVALAAQPSSLNPVLGNSGSADYIVQYPIFDSLTEFNSETGQVDPRLAESWEFTDPRTFVMQLRAGVKFQDGTPMDAEAVQWFLDYARGPEGGKGSQVDLAGIDAVDVTGPLQVTLRLKAPFSGLPWVLSGRPGMVISPTAYQADPEGFPTRPVGAGPYKFVSYAPGAKLELERFADYWNAGAIFPDAIEFTIFREPTTIVNAIKTGEQDLSFSVSPKDVAMMKTAPNVDVVTGESVLLDQLHMNRSIKPLDNPKVREALSLAIDRDAFVKAATFGLGEPGYQFAPEGGPAASTNVAKENAYNPDRARQLLAEAGYPQGFSVTMLTQPGELEVRKAEVLQSQLAEVGISITIQPTELTQAVTEMFQQNKAGLFFAYGVNRADVADAMSATFGAKAMYNLPNEAHPNVDKALAAVNEATEPDQRNARLKDAADALTDDHLFTPVAFHPFTAVSTSFVHGIKVDALLKPRLDGIWLTGQ